MVDMSSVDNDHEATANRLHHISLSDQHAGIFSKSNSNARWICGNRLCKPSKSSSFFKMAIEDYISHEAKASCNFHFTFQMRATGIAFIDHRIAHGHGTCGSTCHQEFFVLVSVVKYLQQFRTPKNRT